MDKSTEAILAERVIPHLKDVFDGFVIVGYRTDADGIRRRLAIAETGNDVAVFDGLRPHIMNAVAWRGQAEPPDPNAPTQEGAPE